MRYLWHTNRFTVCNLYFGCTLMLVKCPHVVFPNTTFTLPLHLHVFTNLALDSSVGKSVTLLASLQSRASCWILAWLGSTFSNILNHARARSVIVIPNHVISSTLKPRPLNIYLRIIDLYRFVCIWTLSYQRSLKYVFWIVSSNLSRGNIC